MIRRSFLKFAAGSVIVSALNWTLPRFVEDRLSIVQLIQQRREELWIAMGAAYEKAFWTSSNLSIRRANPEIPFGTNYWTGTPVVEYRSDKPQMRFILQA